MFFFFFFNDTATTEIYTLSLHDALPIYFQHLGCRLGKSGSDPDFVWGLSPFFIARSSSRSWSASRTGRSEEHTSELQSQSNLVCRLLLEKKNKIAMQSSLCKL